MSSPLSRSRSHSRVKVKEEPRSRSRSLERDNFADSDGPKEKRRRDEDYDGPRHRKRRDDDDEGPRHRKDQDDDYDGPRHRKNDRDGDYDGPRNRGVDRDGDFQRPRIKTEPEDDDRPRRSTDRPDRPRDSRGDSRNDRYHRPSRDNERYDSRRSDRDRNRDSEKDFGDRNSDSNGRRRDPAREKDWNNFFKNVDIKTEKPVADIPESEKYGLKTKDDDSAPVVEKEKPNFGLSGKLTEETNTFRGVVIKYSEPPEARKPQKIRWRLYPFKDNEPLETMFIHRQSAYLLGRDRKIADIPIDHPSCSKQHAVIQYRLQPYTRADGTKGRRVKPYIIDLESANGTLVNDAKIESKRYVELFEKDVLKFGFSSREYVLLHEHSKGEPDDDEPEAPVSPLPEEKPKKIKAEKKEKD